MFVIKRLLASVSVFPAEWAETGARQIGEAAKRDMIRNISISDPNRPPNFFRFFSEKS